MNKEELKKYRFVTGYNLAQLELDYLQHIFLAILYEKYDRLYFKGGTALQKGYGLRSFSEDLDFNYVDIDIDELIKYVLNNSPFETEIKEVFNNTFGSSIVLSIKGVLFDGSNETKCKLTFDFRKNDTYLQTTFKKIQPQYPDLLTYSVILLNEEEIIAEKIRAILTRNKARDVFDLYYLLQKDTKINFELVDKKLKPYNIEFSKQELIEKLSEHEKNYVAEISQLTKEFPKFKECFELILKRITQ